MSIKPIDFQVMLPKTPEVSKIHNDQAQRNIAAQQSQASTVQNRAENNLKQVYSKDKSQQAAIRKKQEKGQQGSGEKKKKQNGKPTSEKEMTEYGSKTTTIDIRL